MDNEKITMLGTGSAMATRYYNTCFLLEAGNAMLLVDAGGGNGILSQLEKGQVDLGSLHDMFITHAHTDHILGAVWVVRSVMHRIIAGTFSGTFNVYANADVIRILEQICRLTLPDDHLIYLGWSIFLNVIDDGQKLQLGDMQIEFFDIFSVRERQFGFSAKLPSGQRLVCLGDEPYNEKNRRYAENADWLLCEAFCLYRDRDIFRPYEKYHSTAMEAGALASRLNVSNLLLYHTEDRTLADRKQAYTSEARSIFRGNVFVPDDLDVIHITPIASH